jgi:sugar phosphate isomerase/epimerase
MEKIDMWEVQKTLGSRLKAYHVHDNAGNADSHLPFMSGVAGGIDWERFVEGVVKFTPNAALTFEYNVGRENDYIADREKFLAMAANVTK